MPLYCVKMFVEEIRGGITYWEVKATPNHLMSRQEKKNTLMENSLFLWMTTLSFTIEDFWGKFFTQYQL